MLMVSCNRVNVVSDSVTLLPPHLFLLYVTSLRGLDHCVTYMFTSTYQFSTNNIVIT